MPVNNQVPQAYILAKSDFSEAVLIAPDLESLDRIARDRFDLPEDADVKAFLNANDYKSNVIQHLPINELAKIEHRAILATSETLLATLKDNAHVKNLREEIELYESMAEVVVRSVEPLGLNNLNEAKAKQYLEAEFGVQTREPRYKMTSKGENKDYIVFPDGSEIDQRGGKLLANPKIDERIDAIESLYRHNYAQRVNADVKLSRDYFAEITLDIKEHRDFGHGPRRN